MDFDAVNCRLCPCAGAFSSDPVSVLPFQRLVDFLWLSFGDISPQLEIAGSQCSHAIPKRFRV